MTRADLTSFELDIMQLAHKGLSNRQIAERVGRPFNCIITTFSNIKRGGHQLPTHRPLDITAERARLAQVRREQGARPGVKNYQPPPRYTAKGVKPSTGERFEVTSDSQSFADEHLAAMLGETGNV